MFNGVSDVARRFSPSIIRCIPAGFIVPGGGSMKPTAASISSVAVRVLSHPVERADTTKASTPTSKE